MRLPGIDYASPNTFSARQRLVLNTVSPLLAAAIRTISITCRHTRLGRHFWEDTQKTHGRAIVAVWHESTTLGAYYYRGSGIHALASYSFDAELGVRAINQLGICSVRGSSSNGGSSALHDLARVLAGARSVILTLDGPRGPRRIAKPGAAILAARTGVPVIPHAFAVRAAWRLHSWDRLVIAKPFTRVISMYGAPIPPPANTDLSTIEETRLLVELALNEAYRKIEDAAPTNESLA